MIQLKKAALLSLGLAACSAGHLSAQQSLKSCGTVFTARNVSTIQTIPAQLPGGGNHPTSTEYVKIQFHIICSGDISTAPINTTQITNAFNVLNTKFTNSGVQFVQCKAPRYVLFSPYSNLPYASFAAESAVGKNDIANTINIYISSTIAGYGGYTYFNNTTDRIFLSAAANLADGLVLSHEMGHFFGLLHTNGSSPSGTNELVNGSNSATAGDFIQDTPADPAYTNYMLSGSGSCTYPFFPFSGSPCTPPAGYSVFCDANGQQYQPLGNNLMFPTYCTSFHTFTAKQLQKINSTYNTYFTNKYTGGFDLISKDHPDDKGYEPTQSGDWIWVFKSPDIWNCRNPNTCTDHQEPGYLGGATYNNYLRVRVKNDGCANSVPATLRAYWTLGSTGETWPASWTTQDMCGSTSLPGGREIPNPDNTFGQTIPVLSPGQETILTFPWDPIDPTPYTCLPVINGQTDMTICVLSRIESPQDPMYDEVNGPIDHNVRYNNNIVTRNTKLVPLTGSKPGRGGILPGGVLVQNPFPATSQFDLHVASMDPHSDFFNDGALIVTLSDNLWDQWTKTGRRANDITVFDENLHQVSVTGNNAVLQNIVMETGNTDAASFEFYLNNAVNVNAQHTFGFYQTIAGKTEMAGSACLFDVDITPDGPVSKPADGPGAITKNTVQKLIALYPNPVQHNKATVQLNIPADDVADLYITDLTGRKVANMVKGKSYKAGTYTESIDLSNYANGVYFLRIDMKSGTQTIKFSVNR